MNALIVPFCAVHAHQLDVQPAQQWMAGSVRSNAEAFENGLSVTLMLDTTPVACCGIMTKWEDVGHLWCLLGTGVAGRNFLPFNRIARDWLDRAPFVRIETAVEHDFENGHRWALMHGFRDETQGVPARKYMCGRDFLVYAKVR